MRTFLLLLLCLNFVNSIKAQTIGGEEEMMEEEIIGIEMEEIQTDENTIWQFKENGKIGFKVNKKIVVEPIYDEVKYLSKTSFIVKKEGFYGVIDKTFDPIIPIKYDSLEKKYFGNYLLATKNNKQGTFSLEGKKALAIKYDKIIYCNPENKMALIEDETGNTYFLNKKGKKIKSPLKNITVFKDAIIASIDEKFGVLNQDGIVIPFEKTYIYTHQKPKKDHRTNFSKSNYNAGLFIVLGNEKYGLYTANGKTILPSDYDDITFSSNRHIYRLKKDDKQGLYFKTSKKLLPTIYDKVYTDGMRFVIVTKDQKKGAVDYNAEFVLPVEFDQINIHGFSTSFKVTKNKKVGWYDNKGEVIIPLLYDQMDDFYQSGFSNYYEVRIGENKGVIDKTGNTIVPIEFEYVFPKSNFFIVIKDKKTGLYNKEGKLIQPLKFNVINETITERSNLLYAINDNGTVLLNKKTGEQLFSQSFKDFGYLHNQNKLINPYNENGKNYLLLKDEKNKYGIVDETELTLNVPLKYDAITQKFETDDITYFIAKKGQYYGIINDQNKVIIPFDYQFIEFAFMHSYFPESINFVVKRKNKFGVLDLKGNTLITLKYDELSKISKDNLFKAKQGLHFKLINNKDETLNPGPFDQIANFESNEAQAFYDGKMRVIDQKGTYLVPAVTMDPHEGFDTFEALKLELIEALNNKEDDALKLFAKKIAPTQHLLRYVSKNIFNDKSLGNINTEYAINRYYQMLLEFKYRYWNNEDFYNKKRLTSVDDYTSYKSYYGHSIVTNYRASDPSYGSNNLERLLRRSIKINGFWISSFFMDRRFYKN